MAYKLYDIDGTEVTHHNLQDKGVWCKSGASLEEGFVEVFGKDLNVIINPAKADDPYAPDLLNVKTDKYGDLKTQNTPFFQAMSRFGFDPQNTVVFNTKDRFRYQLYYPDIEIFFAVDWQVVKFEGKTTIEVEPMTGVWFSPFEKLDDLCSRSQVHSYHQRRLDTRGNAKESYVLNLHDPAFVKVV